MSEIKTLDEYLTANELPARAEDDQDWQAGLRRYLTICWDNGSIYGPFHGSLSVQSPTHTGFGSGGWG